MEEMTRDMCIAMGLPVCTCEENAIAGRDVIHCDAWRADADWCITIEAEKLERMMRCGGCGEIRDDVDERYSYGHYAGRYCIPCAKAKYRDQCGLGRDGQGDERELDEYDPNEEYDDYSWRYDY